MYLLRKGKEMSKDDLETQCMNELFGVERSKMIAQIYVKTLNDDITSMLVSNHRGTVYFQDTLDVPEITAIQRCASFVKHDLDSDITEIYPDKLKAEEVLKDAYINYCRINAVLGDNPNEKALKQCETNLNIYTRWNTRGGRE